MRNIVLIAAAITAALTLSGCDKKGNENAAPPAATPTKAPPTLAEVTAFKKKVDDETDLRTAYHLALEAPTDELSQYARDHAEKLQKEQFGTKK